MWSPFRNKVEVNTIWESKDDNPFQRHKVVVLEVKEGYVRYAPYPNWELALFHHSCPISSFRSGYAELQKENQ